MKKIVMAMFSTICKNFFSFTFLCLFILTSSAQNFSSQDFSSQDFSLQGFDSANFENNSEILKYGFESLSEGRILDAYAAFEYGAGKGNLPSQWKLAKMLKAGVGGKYDDRRAYRLFETIAKRFFKNTPKPAELPYVSDSVVALGDYALTGIANSAIKVDYVQAEFYYFRAAALYNSKEAQYKLGNLYNSELLGNRRLQSAMRWYELACKQGHVMALSRLGEILFSGVAGEKNITRGLAYLSFAARDKKCLMCQEIYNAAYKKATARQQDESLRLVDKLNLAKTLSLQNN